MDRENRHIRTSGQREEMRTGMPDKLRKKINVTLLLFAVLSATMFSAACSGRGLKALFVKPEVLDEYKPLPTGSEMADPVMLTRYTSDELFGQLSADGTYLVYTSNQKGSLDIWIKDLATGITERQTDHTAEDTQPTFSPDGKRIAFVSMRDDAKGDIFIMKVGSNKPQKITDRRTADSFPVYDPSGKFIYFASGPEGKMRVGRYDIENDRVAWVTPWGGTHPAVSPDGELLAYTQMDQGVGRIVIKRKDSKDVRFVTKADFHCGFPTFSADGKSLIFSRFYNSRPGVSIGDDDNATLWKIPVSDVFKYKPEQLEFRLVQLTSGKQTHLRPQGTASGIVYTTRQSNNYDIWMIPESGIVPQFDSAPEQLEFALSLEDQFDSLLALRNVWRFADSDEFQEALYRGSLIHEELGEYAQQERLLTLLSSQATEKGDWRGLAQIDSAVHAPKMKKALEALTGERLKNSEVDEALNRLDDIERQGWSNQKLSAYLLMARGDMLALRGKPTEAISTYSAVLEKYPSQRDVGVQAKIKLGEVLSLINDRDLMTGYYLNLFAEFSGYEKWMRRTVANILTLYSDRKKPLKEIDGLRNIVDNNLDKPLLVALLQYRIGLVYESLGQYERALEAMQFLLDKTPEQKREVTQAILKLGEYSLIISDRLREQGRYADALDFYNQALNYYENLSRIYPAKHQYGRMARQNYIKLSLLKARQEEEEGETAQAKKSYARILEFDPTVIQAWRRIIAYEAKDEDGFDRLEKQFEDRIDKDSGDFVAHYCLGYLYINKKEIDEGDLDDAEEEFILAQGINSASPHVQISLGWIYEMRENYFGDAASGWVEEAVEAYDSAFNLNDRSADPQTEADILLNQGNVFSQLGNQWENSFQKYEERQNLKVGFLDRTQETLYHLNFGRAAFNTDRYLEASRHLEKALELARSLKLNSLEAELIARLALNYQEQGEYAISTEYFEKSMKIFDSVGQKNVLAVLTRSIAYNYYLAGDLASAFKKLDESERLLKQHGTRPIEDFIRVGPRPGDSMSPMGFSGPEEERLQQGLRGNLYNEAGQYRAAYSQLEDLRKRTGKFLDEADGTHPELLREMALLYNRSGIFNYQSGNYDKAFELFSQAYLFGERLQMSEWDDESEVVLTTPEKEHVNLQAEGTDGDFIWTLSAEEFEKQVLNATNSAEVLLRRIAESASVNPTSVSALLNRLEIIDWRLQKNQEDDTAPIINLAVELRFWNAIALLSQYYMGAFPLSSGATEVEASFDDIMLQSRRISAPVKYLNKIIKLTTTEVENTEAPEDAPITPYERIRIHVQALINLSETAAYFGGTEFNRRSDDLLNKAIAICEQYELGEICITARIMQAERNNDFTAAEKTINDYISTSSAVLGDEYLKRASTVRRRIFDTAIGMALKAGDYKKAWSWAEAENRRILTDELQVSGYAAQSGEIVPILEKVRGFEASIQELIRSQSPWDLPDARQKKLEEIKKLKGVIVQGYAALENVAGRLHQLLTIKPFDPGAAAAVLGNGEAIASVILHNNSLYLLTMKADGKIDGEKLESTPEQLENALAPEKIKDDKTAPFNVSKLNLVLGEKLFSSIGDAKLLYFDGERTQKFIPVASLAALKGRNLKVIDFSSLQTLKNAFDNRNTYRQTAFVSSLKKDVGNDLDSEKIKGSLPKGDFWKSIAGDVNTQALIIPQLEQNGILFINNPLVFEGISAANMWLHFEAPVDGLGNYKFSDKIDALWHSNLTLFADVRHTGRSREEHLVMDALMVARGLSSYITIDRTRLKSDRVLKFMAILAGSVQKDSAADAVAKAMTALLEDRSFSSETIQLRGYKGMDEAATVEFAKAQMMNAVKAGVALQKAGSVGAAIEQYELAVVYMDLAGNQSFLDKTLQFLIGLCMDARVLDYKKAIRYQSRYLSRIEEAAKSDPKRLQDVLTERRNLANYYRLDTNYAKALEYNQMNIDLLLKYNRRNLAVADYAQRGNIYEFAGDADNALKNYIEAYNIAVETKNTAFVASQARSAARVLRLNMSDYRRSMDYLQKALNAGTAGEFEKLNIELEVARNHLATGSFQNSAKMTQDIISACDDALAKIIADAGNINRDAAIPAEEKKAKIQALFAEKINYDKLKIQAMLDLVNALYRKGDFARALVWQKEGLTLSEKAQNIRFQIMFRNAEGTIYSALGRRVEAVQSTKAALELSEKLGDVGEMANSYNNLGDAYRRGGNFVRARVAFEKALSFDRKLNFRMGLAFDYANLGLNFELMEKYDLAIEHLEKAISISKEINSPINIYKSLLGLGRIYIERKMPVEARKALEEGLKLAQDSGASEWEWRYHLQLGRVERMENRNDAALKHFLAGIDAVEPMPRAVRPNLEGPRLEEVKWELYDEAIEILAENNQAEKAFEMAERYRGRRFLDIVSSTELSFEQSEKNALMARESELRDRLANAKDAYRKATEREKPAAAKALEDARSAYESLISEMTAADKDMPSYVTVNPVNMTKLQAGLGSDSVLISYFMCRNSLVTWTLSDAGLNMEVQRITRTSLRLLMKQFLQQIENFTPTDSTSRKLYDILLAPQKTAWQSKKNLIVAPHDIMHFIPFSALNDGKGPLVSKRAVHYVSSAAELRFTVNPSPTNASAAQRKAIGRAEAKDLPELPLTKQEIASFGYTFKGAKTEFGDSASAAALIDALKNYKHVHIAGHARTNAADPFQAAIYLAPDEMDSGVFTMQKLLGTKVNADLVTLSACETGRGMLAGGDEIIGFTRAFLTAGAKQVISSLWRVSDLTSAILMKHFFRELKKGLSTDEALRAAQLKVMKDYPHPAYWAGFRTEGAL